MKKITINEDEIILMWEKEKGFSKKIVPITEIIKLDKISKITRGEYRNEFYDIVFFLKDNTETSISNEEVLDIKELHRLYDFLINKASDYGYVVNIMDIETFEIKEELFK